MECVWVEAPKFLSGLVAANLRAAAGAVTAEAEDDQIGRAHV